MYSYHACCADARAFCVRCCPRRLVWVPNLLQDRVTPMSIAHAQHFRTPDGHPAVFFISKHPNWGTALARGHRLRALCDGRGAAEGEHAQQTGQRGGHPREGRRRGLQEAARRAPRARPHGACQRARAGQAGPGEARGGERHREGAAAASPRGAPRSREGPQRLCGRPAVRARGNGHAGGGRRYARRDARGERGGAQQCG